MQESSTSARATILIVDDDPLVRRALQTMLEHGGHVCRTAVDGAEGLEMLRAADCDVALIDMHMPRLTGLETLQLVRQINAILPCILVTADASDRLMRQAYQARAYSVIPKPVSKNVVLYTVVRTLRRVYDLTQDNPSQE